jgi:hypothetical protein
MKLREIRDEQPCLSGWKTLLQGMGIAIPLQDEDLDREVSLQFILENNDYEDTIWCLNISKLPLLDLQKFAADMILLYENHEGLHSELKPAMEALRAWRDAPSQETAAKFIAAEAKCELMLCDMASMNLGTSLYYFSTCLEQEARSVAWSVYVEAPETVKDFRLKLVDLLKELIKKEGAQ